MQQNERELAVTVELCAALQALPKGHTQVVKQLLERWPQHNGRYTQLLPNNMTVLVRNTMGLSLHQILDTRPSPTGGLAGLHNTFCGLYVVNN